MSGAEDSPSVKTTVATSFAEEVAAILVNSFGSMCQKCKYSDKEGRPIDSDNWANPCKSCIFSLKNNWVDSTVKGESDD